MDANEDLLKKLQAFQKAAPLLVDSLVGIVEKAKESATGEQKVAMDKALKKMNKAKDIEIPKAFEGINKMFKDIQNVQM